MVSHFSTAFALFAAFVPTSTARSADANATCRYLPGDERWPSMEQWAQLNASVSGRLIATVPAGHVCHDPTYDAAACAALQESWPYPQTQYVAPHDLREVKLIYRTRFVNPAGFMATLFQNATCDPYTPRNQTCTHGNYVEYAINVTGVDDVVAGLEFAQKQNVRLVVKNTGHE